MRGVFVCLLAALAVSASVPKPFKGQQSYVYRFDTQVSSSLAGSTPSEIQQQAATRLRADVHISFTNDRHANVQLQHVRLGELNTELPKPQRVQPLEHFNRVDIPQELKQQLEQPFSVSIVDGVVERINFEESKSEKRLVVATETFSKNIKKAVLNMINLNLKRNDVNGKDLRSMSEDEKTANVFQIPEMTLEGDCYSLYTIQQQNQGRQQEQNDQEQQFNVTKSIDFAKCSKTPVITFGYSPKASQEIKCQQCMRTAVTTQQQQQQNAQQQELIRSTHCQQECQPWKLNADNDVERSTFARFELHGKLDRYAIKRTTILSSYIVKGVNPEAEDAIMQVMSLSELTFKQMSENKDLVKSSFKQSPVDDQLMYSPHFDVDERRFYEAGDESYANNSPFAIVPQKEQKCAHAMRSILKQWAKKATAGYEADTTMHFNRLVQLMRESSVQELKKIEDTITSGSQQQQQDEQQSWCESGSDSQKCSTHARELFIDALAVSATRNTLFVLAEKIVKGEIKPAKATAALQLFAVNIHSPSEQQVEILKKIATHDVAHRSGPLKQAIWLTLGSTIGQLCQQQPTQPTQAYFRVEEMCPRGKREAYKKLLTQHLNDASSQYEQVLALKTIGNAALDVMLPELRKLIVAKRAQPTLVRAEAIDALRRLRTTQSQQIREILMPIFLNTREQPEIRMASLSMILYSQPRDKAVLDQLAFSILAERSQNVKTFVFTALKALSQSPSVAEREIADHLKAQLQVIDVSEEEMRSSRVIRAPIYVSEKETAADQSVFLTLASVASPQSMIPAYIATSLRSALNGQATEENFKVSFTQQNLQQFYDRMSQMYSEYADSDDEQEKSNMERRGAKDLKSLYNSLGLKSRRTGSYYVNSEEFDDEQQQQQDNDDQDDQEQQQQQGGNRRVRDSQKPFAMLVLRASDVDMAILPISEQTLPQIVKKMLIDQQKPSVSELEELLQQIPSGHIQKHGALSLNEKKTKIPTTSGLPLALIRQVTAVGSIEAQMRMQMESSDSSSNSRGLNAHLKLHTSAVVTHMHETVVWTPILSTGVKTLRTAEFNTPVELKVRANKQQVEIKFMPVRGEEKVRFFGIHTLPLTYTRHIEQQTQTKRDARVKSVHNWALEHAQREWRTEQQSESPIVVDGHYHALSTPSQMLQALYTTENNVHIYLNPQQAPREIILRVSGQAFEKNSQHGKPEMDNFYDEQQQSSQNRGFSSIFEEDDEQMQTERDEDRRSSLSKYNKQYASKQAYKHKLVLEAEAKYAQGASARALVKLDGTCDSHMKHCKVFVEAERTPIRWMREQQPWKMNAKLQTIMPELIRDEEEPSAKQSRALLSTEITWGSESEKNELQLRIQAEPTQKTMWSGSQSQSQSGGQQQRDQQQQQQQQQDKWSRFCNKLDINAEYKLKPYAKHVISSVYSALKSRFFWQLRTDVQRRGDENHMRATIVVDPITRQHANISIQTPHERCRIESVQVPASILALSTIQLNRRPSQYHSMSQMVSEFSGFEQATCKANGRRVKTFDGVSYRAPTSSCWSVIAKDCSSEQSRFAVLMKKDSESDDQKLRVKIITQESTIELWRASDNERVKVQIDGKQESDEQKLSQQGIELSYDQAYVQPIRGLKVRFDGEDVKVELSQQFKSKQCGLCGAYDDEEDNEFRQPDGKRSQSLKKFHQSYTQKNEECNEQKYNKFYEENDEDSFDQTHEQQREQARRRYRNHNQRNSQQQQQQQERSQSSWFGNNEQDSDEQQEQEERQNEQRGDEWMNEDSEENTNTKDIKPKQQTIVMEYNNRLCFSSEPGRVCPRGTSPAEEEKQQQKKMSFWCVDRSQGRKFQRQIHHGQTVENEGRAPSFVETIDQPKRCVAY